ncbi:hypothetical protein BGZ47_003007 [Haplosporangium gracile]|nr:hypothetical protein BGZ47_003007 [Haplosporangium gracile]
MTTEDSTISYNAVPRCRNTSSATTCQQLSPPSSPPMSPASSVISESSMSSVDNDSRSDIDDDDNDEEHRSRLQVTYMRPGCIEEHIIKSRTLAAAKVAAASASASVVPSPMEH